MIFSLDPEIKKLGLDLLEASDMYEEISEYEFTEGSFVFFKAIVDYARHSDYPGRSIMYPETKRAFLNIYERWRNSIQS